MSKAYQDSLIIGGREFHSRLFIGTGKYGSPEHIRDAVIQGEAALLTVSLRRMGTMQAEFGAVVKELEDQCLIAANTSGAVNAEEAVKLAQVSTELGLEKWIKLELTPNLRHLLPDPIETLKAAEQLTKSGYKVLPYINADPVLAKRLEEVGVPAVMPLGAPIGTNKGLRTKDQLEIIISEAQVPIIVDAGLGAPSHAAEAMEIGADAVLVNTAIATAGNPGQMAEAFAMAVKAGRTAYTAGLARQSENAQMSSEAEGFIGHLLDGGEKE